MNKYLLVCPVCEQQILTLSKRVNVGILRGIQCEKCSNWLRLNAKATVIAIPACFLGIPKLVNWLMRIFELTYFHEFTVDLFGILLAFKVCLLFWIFCVPLERDPRYKSVPAPSVTHST